MIQKCYLAGNSLALPRGIDDAYTQVMQEHAHRTGLEEGELPCSTSREMCSELMLRLNEEKPCLSTRVSQSST
ncbi:hypothetical protein Patl1_29135 [Pistacia atlantica]|uniref:Uncharacterized protein n=1 Tax=Pistacia atlantica TaxID=434234 RepID=A0ACC1BG13_9ROSI|nr:hypothetical protein Patl1_29135 [Pistacia atlantica]